MKLTAEQRKAIARALRTYVADCVGNHYGWPDCPADPTEAALATIEAALQPAQTTEELEAFRRYVEGTEGGPLE